MESLRKSGTDEDYDEKEQLLTDLSESLANTKQEIQVKKEKKGKEQAKNKQKLLFLRETAVKKLVKTKAQFFVY